LLNSYIDIRTVESQLPIRYADSAVEIPGSRAALSQLSAVPWAIVTSGTKPLVNGWLDVMKLARPPVLVSAEDVPHGKPDPACYALARQKLNLAEDARVLVVEDAPAGIRAGAGAGCEVLGLVTSHGVGEVNIQETRWVVEDLRSLKIVAWDEQRKVVRVEISNALVC
jgi:glycerol 3-phosphatase-1